MTSCSGVVSAPARSVEPVAAEVDVSGEGSFLAVLGSYTQAGGAQAGTSPSSGEDGADAKEEALATEGGDGAAEVALPPEVALMFAIPMDSNIESCAIEGGFFLSYDVTSADRVGSSVTADTQPSSPLVSVPVEDSSRTELTPGRIPLASGDASMLASVADPGSARLTARAAWQTQAQPTTSAQPTTPAQPITSASPRRWRSQRRGHRLRRGRRGKRRRSQ